MKKKINWEKIAAITGIIASTTTAILTIIQIKEMRRIEEQKRLNNL